MSHFLFGCTLRAALLAGAALVPFASRAADLAATPEGAQQIVEFFKTYTGTTTAPALTVEPDGTGYRVAVDIGALTALKAFGVNYESATLTFKVLAQDDGAWRVEFDGAPPIVSHQTLPQGTVDSAVTLTGFTGKIVIDPALGWIRSADSKADKVSLLAHGPGVQESFDFAPLAASATTTTATDGSVSSNTRQSLGAFGFNLLVDPKLAEPRSIVDARPVSIKGAGRSGAIEASLQGLKTKPLLDAWVYAVAHAAPNGGGADEASVRSIVTALATSHPSLKESFRFEGMSIEAPRGTIGAGDGVLGFDLAANDAASHLEEHFVVDGLTLPDAMAPPELRPLIPSSFDVDVKISGVDLNAAASELAADLHTSDQGLSVTPDDKGKIIAKLLGAGPLVIDVAPSRIVAPQLDLAVEGHAQVPHGGKPSVAFTIRARDLDRTIAALNGLPQKTQQELTPVLAMAKGLAKVGPDGVSTWVGELGADGMMKINGMPLGKAPM